MYVLLALVGFLLILLLKVFGCFRTTRFYDVSFSSDSCNQTINMSPCLQAIVNLTYIPKDFNLNSELVEPQIRRIDLKYTPIWNPIMYFLSWKLQVRNIKIHIRDCLPGKRTSLIVVLENVKVSNILSIIGNEQTQVLVYVYLINSKIRAVASSRGALIQEVDELD
jgi:hypothetical protein